MKENSDFLQDQIITYLGNKRSLLNEIEKEIIKIQKKMNKEKTVNLDLFSGSGVVSRLMKKYSSKIISNDLETYSKVISECYLTNFSEFDEIIYDEIMEEITKDISMQLVDDGIFYNNYAPKNDEDIKIGERVFFTSRNAKLIDTILTTLERLEEESFPHIESYKKFILGPLLSEVSIKTNTAGVFKGFYKNSSTGKGQFGGNGEYALSRIKSEIILNKPVFSNFESSYEVYQEDANSLVKHLKNIDITYIDPPYNQHPYGSNYFMLNILVENELPQNISKVSGIPQGWNRSSYNNKNSSIDMIEHLMKDLDSTFVIMSYSSDGFIAKRNLVKTLEKYDVRGYIDVNEIVYNTYRGSRNLNERSLHIKEYLFIVQLKEI